MFQKPMTRCLWFGSLTRGFLYNVDAHLDISLGTCHGCLPTMQNEYRGEWTEQEIRVVDRIFRGWILHKTRQLYRAQFRRYEITATSIDELILKAGEVVDASVTIFPVRGMPDIEEHDRYPDRVEPMGWDSARVEEDRRIKARLLKMIRGE